MVSLAGAATAYAKRGLRVFPLRPGGKEPLGEAAPHGCKDASTDAVEVAEWWAKYPDANIGIATGPDSGVWVLDVDGPEGAAALAALETEHGPLPATAQQTTGAGRHMLFAWPPTVDIRNTSKKLGPGLDTRGDGGYIVAAPSIHPSGAQYRWTAAKATIADAPAWLLGLLTRKERPPSPDLAERPTFAAVPEAYGRRALEGEYDKVATAGVGKRNQFLNEAAFNLGQLAAVDAVRWVDIQRVLTAAAVANGYLAEEGATHVDHVIRSGFEAGLQKPREIKISPRPSRALNGARLRIVGGGAAAAAAIEPDDDPDANPDASPRSLNAKGELKANAMRNITRIIQELEPGLFAWDEHAGHLILTRRPPWALNGFTAGSQVSDADETGCLVWLEDQGQSASLNSVHAAIQYVASQNHVHPLRDTLKALEWDAKPRLNEWLCDFLDAPSTAFVRTVAAKWMIGAVARIMRPGAKVDTMLILEGPQGLKKSTALATLATIGGVEYFADKLPALGSKDAAMELQGKVIVEIAELDALRRAEVSQIKAWLSQRLDRFRPPYGRNVIERPRQCVFAGTVNPGATGYLNDPTGGRRFWPVKVNRVDIEGLREAAPQLWAEAVSRFNAGESWWLDEDPELLNEAREQQRERYDVDVWGDRIDRFVATKPRVRIAEILADIDIPQHLWTENAKRRVGAHLRFRGWTRKQWRDPERANQPTSYFFPPEEEETATELTTYI